MSLVCLPPFWSHPLVVDEVTKVTSVVIQPGISHSRGLRGRSILQSVKQIGDRWLLFCVCCLCACLCVYVCVCTYVCTCVCVCVCVEYDHKCALILLGLYNSHNGPFSVNCIL